MFPNLQGSIPKTQGNALPGITNPGVVTILLHLLLGCDDAAERTTTLGALRRVIGGSVWDAVKQESSWQPPMHVLQSIIGLTQLDQASGSIGASGPSPCAHGHHEAYAASLLVRQFGMTSSCVQCMAPRRTGRLL